ncbi:MAG: AAA family ATPase [Candidatus Polarisedimenticolaceae bacterium]|nr:AAA family ATPase [Candidatus Polarisedimenticolaceae bacterium]
MITKFKSIGNLAVFKDFIWDDKVVDAAGNIQPFKDINILYGRNYSGKTTLSRIFRAIETGELSDKFEAPSFCVALKDGSEITQDDFHLQERKIRVFNEDFVRDNLRFISNPDESIESFAILGDDNNKIEQEIEALGAELGSNEEGKETGLYAQQSQAVLSAGEASVYHTGAGNNLEGQLKTKATDRKIGIKYNSERFGDQNYTIRKLENEIKVVLGANYQALTNKKQAEHEKLIKEKANDQVPPFQPVALLLSKLSDETETLVTRKISGSNKIEALVADALLNKWVDEGRAHHQGKRQECAFCGNVIPPDRWSKLEKHFDEESERLKKEIKALIARVGNEKKSVSSLFSVSKELFYSKFHPRLEAIEKEHEEKLEKYISCLDSLISQLTTRRDALINTRLFTKPEDCSNELVGVWDSYKVIRIEADDYTDTLDADQKKAKEALRLREVSEFVVMIKYSDQLNEIQELKTKLDTENSKKEQIENEIKGKVALIEAKKRELNDEEKGAIKVNEYLTNFFGHDFLSLEAKDENGDPDQKIIRFEVIRDGKKAYHLSEGECSLLAFCYFLAKLDDIDTKGSKPIIWIDDPISSLDSNHIFFVYSLLSAEIVLESKFEQLFISTHNLDFLKYLKRIKGKYLNHNANMQDYDKAYFVINRQDKLSTINLMPKYLKEYVTEFNYLFHQIYKCASIGIIDDSNYTTFYHFGNNARKFLEIYLYYKYPDSTQDNKKQQRFFGDEMIPAVLTDRINNEYSHLAGTFERGAAPVEVPEMQKAAQLIIERLKKDTDQYEAFLKSIGE